MSDPILALLGSTLFLPLLVVYLLVLAGRLTRAGRRLDRLERRLEDKPAGTPQR